MRGEVITKNGNTISYESHCFDRVGFDKRRRAIRYFAPFGNLTPAMVDFWITFLRTFLTYCKWECQLDLLEKRVIFTLRPSHKRSRDLLYLSAFRYLECFPLVVKAMYEETTGMTDDERFRFFHGLHMSMRYDKDWSGRANLTTLGDGAYVSWSYLLINPSNSGSGGGSSLKSISLRRYRWNIWWGARYVQRYCR